MLRKFFSRATFIYSLSTQWYKYGSLPLFHLKPIFGCASKKKARASSTGETPVPLIWKPSNQRTGSL